MADTASGYCKQLIISLFKDMKFPLEKYDQMKGTETALKLRLTGEFISLYPDTELFGMLKKSINQRYKDIIRVHDEKLFTQIPEQSQPIKLNKAAIAIIEIIKSRKSSHERDLIDEIVGNLSFSFIVSMIRDPWVHVTTSQQREILWKYLDSLLELIEEEDE